MLSAVVFPKILKACRRRRIRPAPGFLPPTIWRLHKTDAQDAQVKSDILIEIFYTRVGTVELKSRRWNGGFFVAPRLAHVRQARRFEKPDLLNWINLIPPVQSHPQKYSRSSLPQIKTIPSAVPPPRGAFRDRHGREAGCGGR
jgi:hypothetical protein